MKKLAFALAAVGAVLFASDFAAAQGRGGGGGGGARGGGGSGWQGGGHSGGGGAWQGGGGSRGGAWQGGGGYRGSGWHAGGGYRGWNGGGYRGWYGSGWRGGWYGSSVGIYLGWPGYWGGWPYYPYTASYAVSYPVYTEYPVYSYLPSESTTFVQAAPEPAATNYWYYCVDPAGYYPYVQNCSKAWMQVVPQNVPSAPAPQ